MEGRPSLLVVFSQLYLLYSCHCGSYKVLVDTVVSEVLKPNGLINGTAKVLATHREKEMIPCEGNHASTEICITRRENGKKINNWLGKFNARAGTNVVVVLFICL